MGDVVQANFVLHRIMFGVALHQGRGDDFTKKMANELAELKANEPPTT